MDTEQPVEQNTSILTGTKSHNTDNIPASTIFTEEYLPVVEKKKTNPILNKGPDKALNRNNLLDFAESLPPGLKEPLFSTTGKNSNNMKHPDASFTSEYRFRHIIPFLYTGNYLSKPDKRKLESCCRQAKMFSILWDTYGSIDTTSIKGFQSYEKATDEVTLNQERIRLHTAAFLQHNCDVEKLIYYLRGPHIGKQPQWKKIIDKIRVGVHPNVLLELERVYKYGAPRKVNATNTEENLLQYFLYGNHDSAKKIRKNTKK